MEYSGRVKHLAGGRLGSFPACLLPATTGRWAGRASRPLSIRARSVLITGLVVLSARSGVSARTPRTRRAGSRCRRLELLGCRRCAFWRRTGLLARVLVAACARRGYMLVAPFGDVSGRATPSAGVGIVAAAMVLWGRLWLGAFSSGRKQPTGVVLMLVRSVRPALGRRSSGARVFVLPGRWLACGPAGPPNGYGCQAWRPDRDVWLAQRMTGV